MAEPIELVCCYARDDETDLGKLLQHLKPLEHAGEIRVWHDHQIEVGTDRNKAIETHLDGAQIVILLISPAFLSSEYCYSKQMQRALERQARGETWVVPVILYPCLWSVTPIGKLQVLPPDGKPINDWPSEHTALLRVVEGVQGIVSELRTQVMTREAEALYKIRKYPEALRIYTRAVELYRTIQQPTDRQRTTLALLYQGTGDVLYAQHNLDEALRNFNLALELNPSLARSNERKGYVLFNLKRYSEALPFLELGIQQDPDNPHIPPAKIDTLILLEREQEAAEFCAQILPRFPHHYPLLERAARLFWQSGKYEQALQAWEELIHLIPDVPESYQHKAEVLEALQRYEEALTVYEKMAEFKKDDPLFFTRKGRLLTRLWRYAEALDAYEEATRLSPYSQEAHFGKRGVYEALMQIYAIRAREAENKGQSYHGQFKLIYTLREHSAQISALALSADGITLASGSHDRRINIWQFTRTSKARRVATLPQNVREVAFSPDGSILVAVQDDGTLTAWESASGAQRFTLRDQLITCVTFSPDGQWLICGCWDAMIKTWLLQTLPNGQAFSWPGLQGTLVRIAISPSGKIIASGGEDNTIKLWDFSSPGTPPAKELALFLEHKALVWGLHFSPDERTLFSASQDQTILAWNIVNKKMAFCLYKAPQPLLCWHMSANGRWLAYALADNIIDLWHLSSSGSWTLSESLKLPSGSPIGDLAFNYNGRVLIAGLADGTLMMWMRE